MKTATNLRMNSSSTSSCNLLVTFTFLETTQWKKIISRVSVILFSINYRFTKLSGIQFLGGFKWNIFTNLSWKRRCIKNKNGTKERKSSHCTLGNQDNVRQVSLEYTSVSCLLHNRYRYRLFFLRSIAHFLTQIYMNCFVSS